MSRESEILNLFNITKKEFGRIDILIKNAGIFTRGKFVDFSMDDFDEMMNINLKAVYVCCQQALKMRISRKKDLS